MATNGASIAHNLKQPSQADIDAGREREIETARLAMVRADAAGDKRGAREFQRTMYALIEHRSDEQKARLAEKLPKPWGTPRQP